MGSSLGSSDRLGHLVLFSCFSTGDGLFCSLSRRYSARLSDLGFGSETAGATGGRASPTGGDSCGSARLDAAAGLSEDRGGRTAEGAADESSSFSVTGENGFGVSTGRWENTAVGKPLGRLVSGLVFKSTISFLVDTDVATGTFLLGNSVVVVIFV